MKSTIVTSVFLLLSTVFTSCMKQPQAITNQDVSEIKSVLDKQLSAWNNGDLKEFMSGYHKSDSIRFITSNGTLYGWNTVYENYTKSFPKRDDMGTLFFTYDSFYLDRGPFVNVEGNWLIHRSDTVGGRFVLTFKEFNSKWQIIEDHTW